MVVQPAPPEASATGRRGFSAWAHLSQHARRHLDDPLGLLDREPHALTELLNFLVVCALGRYLRIRLFHAHSCRRGNQANRIIKGK
jgi:hypothetical protein